MAGSYTANTLQYDSSLCTGCKICQIVCPHAVFEIADGTARLARPEDCMECGACQLNCPKGAINVDSGVGCAYAMFLSALTGRKEITCGGSCK
jgi:NAD-dependent dihydropyrimidine dehydrogenase PreA subunit